MHQRPWRLTRNPYPPIEPLSADEIESIHQASLTILEEMGIRIMLPEALAVFRQAGADVDDGLQHVRIERGLIDKALATTPTQFTLHARNPERHVPFGGNWTAFGTVGGAPNVSDLDGGRRPGNYRDFCELIKLSQSLNVVHFHCGYAPEPIDIDVAIRHLVATQAYLTLSDKAIFSFTFTPQRMQDTFEMVRIARGVSAETMMREPSFYSIVNTNSPLVIDRPMLWGIIEMARLNQILCVTPFTLAGAMAPITLPGALAQANAEALAAIVLSQSVRPGAPVIYGGFTPNVDMRSGAPAFGTPEYIKSALIGGQMARRYRLPYRSSNVNSSNAPDAQSAYEGAMSIWGALMGHCNMLAHGVGWLEGGLVASYEKYIIDAEMLQTMAAFFEPEKVDEGTLALDAIREVGPGGHFFGAKHTLERYETAFYTPLLSDWRTYQQWSADGALSATQRANKIWKTLLAEYEPPAMDPAVREELDAFVERRTREGGAPIP